jgi:glycosyltransferase involved in cell wall biosynthesis
MITRHRRELVVKSIRYFLAQDYPNKELVIFDNSDASEIAELAATFPNQVGPGRQVRYYQHARKASWKFGTLRNLAADVTNGDLIANWDDDDWYHPRRLSYQVDMLAGAELGSLSSCLWWDELSDPPCVWKYDNGTGYGLGSSLIYSRKLWQAHPFAEESECDNPMHDAAEFVPMPGVTKDGRAYMIARMHHRNTNVALHAGIRRIWEQDPERINQVWSKLDDPATAARVKELLA